jgi:DNA-binding NarL/FixJ family response regulator
VLADLPQLVADMLERAVAAESDMVVVDRLHTPAALAQITSSPPPDVVVVGMTDDELSTQFLDLLAENAGLTVLGVQKRRGVAHLYQLRPYHAELGEVAPEDLVSEIRTAAETSLFSKWRAIPRSQP